MNNKKGFTMVELLVVLVIVAILAAVATPIYLANVERSRASEAVATMALIRQAERDFRINANTYFNVLTAGAGSIANPLPLTVTGGVPDPTTAGLNVDNNVTQYFANDAFTVDATLAVGFTGASLLFTNPDAVDFVISVDGSSGATDVNAPCTGATATDCGVKAGEVDLYRLEMDNSGRTFVSYADGAAGTWAAY